MVIQQKAGGEIIAAIDNHIIVVQHGLNGFGRDARFMRGDVTMRIDFVEGARRDRDFGGANIIGAKQRLALQVGEADHVIINQAQMANPSSGEILPCRIAEPAHADQKHLGLGQLLLTWPTDFL